ncbi:MAG: hypothetical protein ACI8PZ_000267 [Myxococcota bacterium]|jgi:hypothetical protein
MDGIHSDLETLRQVTHRHAGSEGERRMLHEVRERLPAGTASRIEGFVAFTSPHVIIGLHAAVLLLAGVAGFQWPLAALVVCALGTASLVAEGTGRFSALRWILPKEASYNLVVHRPAAETRGAVVVAAPLDAPRWTPNRPQWMSRPLRAVVWAAMVVTAILALRALAEPWGRPTQAMYVVSLIVFAVTVLLGALMQRSVSAQADASGCAAALDLDRRLLARPVDGLDLWIVFTGCAHAYQNGMHAFLAMHRKRLVDPVLVVVLDDPGSPPFGAVRSEGALTPIRHRPTGPALIERLRWSGLAIPEVDRPEATDAHAATEWGYRALALSGADGTSDEETCSAAVDVVEAAIRMYGDDVARVPALSLRTPAEEAS